MHEVAYFQTYAAWFYKIFVGAWLVPLFPLVASVWLTGGPWAEVLGTLALEVIGSHAQ